MKSRKLSIFIKIAKIPNFSGASKISNFRQKQVSTFLKFMGIVISVVCENAKICTFPEIFEVKADFSPKNVDPSF